MVHLGQRIRVNALCCEGVLRSTIPFVPLSRPSLRRYVEQ